MSRFDRNKLGTRHTIAVDRIATDTHLALLEKLTVLDEIGLDDYMSGRRATSTLNDLVETSRRQHVRINRLADDVVYFRHLPWWDDVDALVEHVPVMVSDSLAAQIDRDVRSTIDKVGDPAKVAFVSALHNTPTDCAYGFVKTYGGISMRTVVNYDIRMCSEGWSFDVMYGIGVLE